MSVEFSLLELASVRINETPCDSFTHAVAYAPHLDRFTNAHPEPIAWLLRLEAVFVVPACFCLPRLALPSSFTYPSSTAICVNVLPSCLSFHARSQSSCRCLLAIVAPFLVNGATRFIVVSCKVNCFEVFKVLPTVIQVFHFQTTFRSTVRNAYDSLKTTF